MGVFWELEDPNSRGNDHVSVDGSVILEQKLLFFIFFYLIFLIFFFYFSGEN